MIIKKEIWINQKEFSTQELTQSVISAYIADGYKVDVGTNQTHLVKEQIITLQGEKYAHTE